MGNMFETGRLDLNGDCSGKGEQRGLAWLLEALWRPLVASCITTKMLSVPEFSGLSHRICQHAKGHRSGQWRWEGTEKKKSR